MQLSVFSGILHPYLNLKKYWLFWRTFLPKSLYKLPPRTHLPKNRHKVIFHPQGVIHTQKIQFCTASRSMIFLFFSIHLLHFLSKINFAHSAFFISSHIQKVRWPSENQENKSKHGRKHIIICYKKAQEFSLF